MMRTYNTAVAVNKGCRVTMLVELGGFLSKKAEWFRVTLLSHSKDLQDQYMAVLKETVEARAAWRQNKSGSYTYFPKLYQKTTVFLKPVDAPTGKTTPEAVQALQKPVAAKEPQAAKKPEPAPVAKPAVPKPVDPIPAEPSPAPQEPAADPAPAPAPPKEDSGWWKPFSPFS